MINQEDVALLVARELRLIAQEIEARCAASQRGELFEGLDGRVHLPPIVKVYRKAVA